MRIGILGCGNIGTFLLEQLNRTNDKAEIVAVYSRNYDKAKKVAASYRTRAYRTIDSFLEANLDLVVEVATIEAVQQTALTILNDKIPLILSSIGALSDQSFLESLKDACYKSQVHLYIPSGAIGGLDILQSANVLKGLKEVQLTTRKPADSLIDGVEMAEEKLVFYGKAKDAIAKFPRNMNVAIALSLAGIGVERTIVKIVADPKIDKNNHTIEASGDFGNFSLMVSNEAMPNNPKTSYLAALSILSSIKEQSNRLKII